MNCYTCKKTIHEGEKKISQHGLHLAEKSFNCMKCHIKDVVPLKLEYIHKILMELKSLMADFIDVESGIKLEKCGCVTSFCGDHTKETK